MNSVIKVVVLLCLPVAIVASCSYSMMEDNTVCVLNGRTLQIGESYNDTDECQTCECFEGAVSCCGLGYFSGQRFREGCTEVLVPPCDYKFVREDNPDENCCSTPRCD